MASDYDVTKGADVAFGLRQMGYKFYYDRVMVLLDPAQKAKLGSGLLVAPDNMEEKSYAGTVVALGCGDKVREWGIQLLDRVIVARYAPTECKVTLPDGSDVVLASFHVHDMYMGWEDADVRKRWEELNVPA